MLGHVKSRLFRLSQVISSTVNLVEVSSGYINLGIVRPG
jgi:hypothetical protein